MAHFSMQMLQMFILILRWFRMRSKNSKPVHFLTRIILTAAAILVVAFVLTKTTEILVSSPASESWCTNNIPKPALIGIAADITTGVPDCDYKSWKGFPLTSQFCGTIAELKQGCVYPNTDGREPLYIFGTPYNDWTRFQLNYLFWIMVTGIFWLPTRYISKNARRES